MEDRLGPHLVEEVVDRLADVAHVELGPGRDVLLVAVDERVDDGDLVAACDERIDDVRADEAGSSGHDRPHGRILLATVGWSRCSSRSRAWTARGSRRRRSSCGAARGGRGRGRLHARARRDRARREDPRPRSSRRPRDPVGGGAPLRGRASTARRGSDPSRARARRGRRLRPLRRLVRRLPGRRARARARAGARPQPRRRRAASCPTAPSCSSSTRAGSRLASAASTIGSSGRRATSARAPPRATASSRSASPSGSSCSTRHGRADELAEEVYGALRVRT